MFPSCLVPQTRPHHHQQQPPSFLFPSLLLQFLGFVLQTLKLCWCTEPNWGHRSSALCPGWGGWGPTCTSSFLKSPFCSSYRSSEALTNPSVSAGWMQSCTGFLLPSAPCPALQLRSAALPLVAGSGAASFPPSALPSYSSPSPAA